MRQLIWFELKKALSFRKVLSLAVTIVVLCGAAFTFIQLQADYLYVEEVQAKYQGSVSVGAIAEAVVRHKELLTLSDTVGLTPQETEEFLSLETPLHLNRCDEVRKTNLSKYGIVPDTLTIGNTISYGFMEDFIRNYFPFIICFVIAFLVGPVFSSEYESKMDGLLLATKNGKRKVIIAKMVASFIITISAHLSIISVFMLPVLIAYGISDFDVSFVFTAGNPFIYLSSPFDFTVLQYTIIMILVSLLGCVAYCIFSLFISSKSKHSVISSMVAMAGAYIPLLAYITVADEEALLTNILRFAYSQIINVKTLFSSYNTVNIGILEIQTVYLSLTFICLLSVVLAILTYRAFRKHQVSN